MDLRFDGRVAVVTGAGRGIGREHALLLAQRGARLVVNDLGVALDGRGRDAGPAQETVDAILAAGGIAVASVADVATIDGAASIAATALQHFDRIDVLVSNAGIMVFDDDFASLDVERFERQLRINLTGSLLVAQACWPAMVASGGGSVILTSSSAVLGGAALISYGTAKAGLIGLGRSLAQAGEPHAIRVNVLFPGGDTRMSDVVGTPVEEGARLASGVAARSGWERSPQQVSPLVAYMAHETCTATGQIFTAVGGSVTRIVLAETDGYVNPDLTPEDVRDNWSAIYGEDALTPLPNNPAWSGRARERILAAHSAARR